MRNYCCNIMYLLSMEPWAVVKKNFQLVWRCHHLLSGFLAPSVTSVTSVANDKDDNEMMPGAVHRSPAFTLQLRKTPETSARRPSDEGAVRPVIASNGPFTSK